MFPVAGKKLYIGNTVMADQDDDWDSTDFSTQTWTEIKGWVTQGQIGNTRQLVTSDQINAAYTKKLKGTGNSGSMQNTFDILPGDAGQAALLAAIASDDNYAFKIEWPLLTGQSTPNTRLFVALAMSDQEQGGGPNTPDRFQSTLEIQNNVVRVAST
jgi:hypothetical protein